MTIKRRIFLYFASLKLAVLNLLILSFVLGWGTVVESWYGMRSAKAAIYGTTWFAAILFFLGVNVLCAALVRYPWKKHQTGFVITHLGIIVVLIGSVITQRWGIDGSLPVEQGSESSTVVLSDSMLTLVEEDSGKKQQFRVPESSLKRTGNLLEIQLTPDKKLTVVEYLPRADHSQTLMESPLPGVGHPAVKVELFNPRFHLEEQLVHNVPDVPTIKNLGPATISFRKLWSIKEEAGFLQRKPAADQSNGFVLASYFGREFRIPIVVGQKTKRNIDGREIYFTIDRYFNYAIVSGTELVEKSSDPVNPAVQLTLSDPQSAMIEKHTVFVNFPEFPTRHANKSFGPPSEVQLKMVRKTHSKSGAQLALAQTVDGKRLLYRIQSKEGKITDSGEAKVDETQTTGWMDLKFKITSWIPNSVLRLEPQYVEKISGANANFLSAIRIRVEDTRKPSTSSKEINDDLWLMEGNRRSVIVRNRRYLATFSKEELELPFKIALEKFTIGHDPGTTKAASYASDVMVKDDAAGKTHKQNISMNEPLVYSGYTFYQASYQLSEGRPPVSIFSVNWDPGRFTKYLGSALLCLGILIMFYMNPHYFGKISMGLFGRKQ